MIDQAAPEVSCSWITVNSANSPLLKIDGRKRTAQDSRSERAQEGFMADKNDCSPGILFFKLRAYESRVSVGEKGVRNGDFVFTLQFLCDNLRRRQRAIEGTGENPVGVFNQFRNSLGGFFHFPDPLLRQRPVVVRISCRPAGNGNSMSDTIKLQWSILFVRGTNRTHCNASPKRFLWAREVHRSAIG